MNLRKLSLAAAALTLFALPTFAASPQKPGNWQITMEMEGTPVKMPPMTFTHCVTKEDTENPENAVPKGRQNANCKVSDFKVDGNKVSWSVKCEGKQPVDGHGELTFDGDSYSGWSKMKMGENEITTKMSGKRLGDCSK
ncbi:MAG TPA: DUF3617 family protein [Thermoanaerobaculia bacterium]|nr:DUF3617 family protein [Thermoanaerobaculia bacterium]